MVIFMLIRRRLYIETPLDASVNYQRSLTGAAPVSRENVTQKIHNATH